MRQKIGGTRSRIIGVALLLLASGFGWGDSPAVAGTLKNSVRVGDRSAMNITRVPGAGQRRLPVMTAAPAPAPASPSPRNLDHGWFWERHAPDAPASPGRWAEALASLEARRARGSAMFDPARLDAIARRYQTQIAAAAQAHGVSELLLLAVIAVESAGQSQAVSPKGARGLMQLIPATARRFGVGNSFDPAENIGGGAAYLDWLLRTFRDDPILALAGYNAGEGAVQKYKGVPPYAETRDYVVKVFDALAAAKALCAAAADSPRRACGWPAAPQS